MEVVAHYAGSREMLSEMLLSGLGDIFIPALRISWNGLIKAGAVDTDSIRIVAYLIPAVIVLRKLQYEVGQKMIFIRKKNICLMEE